MHTEKAELQVSPTQRQVQLESPLLNSHTDKIILPSQRKREAHTCANTQMSSLPAM